MAIPVAVAYSPKTKTDGITAIDAVVIVIDDAEGEGIDCFPVASVTAPGVAVLCTSANFDSEDPADYETIYYTERDTVAFELKGVTRAKEGTAREWPAGSAIASYTPALAWNDLRSAAITTGFKNVIINGNFDIWERGTSLAAGVGGYIADRWNNLAATATIAPSQQTFTVGQTDVPGEPTYYHRSVVVAGNNDASVARTFQRIEDVRTFAGQTVTVSFYAKADADKFMSVEFAQNFGTGGAPSADVTATGAEKLSLTTAWQKFTKTVAIPSITGKTIGTTANTSYLEFNFWFDSGADNATRASTIGYQSGTFDIAQVQIEAGLAATSFERRFVGAESSFCQRYYRTLGGVTNQEGIAMLVAVGTNAAQGPYVFDVPMRDAPTITFTGDFTVRYRATSVAVTSIATASRTPGGFLFANVVVDGTPLTLGDAVYLRSEGATLGIVKIAAEL